MWKKIPSLLKNKYLLVFVIFIVWLTFFDRNNFISQLKLGRILNNQRQQKEFYKAEIHRDSTGLQELMSDSASLEKFAREKYLMKKENEDIFLIVKDKNEK